MLHREDTDARSSSLDRAHAFELRALQLVYDCIQHNRSLHSLLDAEYDPNNVTADDAIFLQQNGIPNGFDRTALILSSPPTSPALQHHDSSIYESKPSSGLAEPPQHNEPASELDATATDVETSPTLHLHRPSGSSSAAEVLDSGRDRSPADMSPAKSRSASRAASAVPKSPSVAPAQVAPPLPEEEAELSDSTRQTLDQQAPSRPAKTVHLPPEEVQEQRYREREVEEERRTGSDTDTKATHRPLPPQTDPASSPSSTIDAHSAATPQPAQDSPDTSPDSETGQLEVLPPKDLLPSPEQQRQEEEHDRLLEAQKDIARRQALGDVSDTPDEQLRWEAREAAARDAEERAAREDINGPEATIPAVSESEPAVDNMDLDGKMDEPVPSEESAQVVEPEVTDASDHQDDGDTIAVAPRKSSAASAAENAQSQTHSGASKQTTPLPGRPERMTTRVSSGALRQKSVSEILGHSQSPVLEQVIHSRKELLSPEPLSPLAQRHRKESASSMLTGQPSRQARAAPFASQNVLSSALDPLEALKGAADDPERDYLEPLFRIQAHESPNSGTKTLPELIRMVPKALSTEDHFTSLHERLDFRMLRRIYQLQNANKWSLRQMDKCKEPEEPVTHLNYMMTEMKWMRKDFSAERKMKKSVCAWLAQRCAEWVAANETERKRLQINVSAKQPPRFDSTTDAVPELEHAADSAGEDDNIPLTPREGSPLPSNVVIAPELASTLDELRKPGIFEKALVALPKTGVLDRTLKHKCELVTPVSKFVDGKVFPKRLGPTKKRSRYDYDDEAEVESQPLNKRRREETETSSEADPCALFDPEYKSIRERLHSNNAFRPPSEFLMPSTSFYEFRSGSQWIWEDDQKLRKLAKDYSFNWSLIADEVSLQTRYKSSAERRTPWECFERWVELDGLPADMRKTLYFKTWFQRLESSQQAAERRYQAQVSVLQQQAAQTGSQAHIPIRRRTVPTRVEKRRTTRYLWMVDGFRKLAKKREQAAWKQAETARAAAQRKTQSEANQVKTVRMTPQEFSKKRQERDNQIAEQHRIARANMLEVRRQQLAAAARANQPQQPNGTAIQNRPQATNAATQQPQQQPNGIGQPSNQAPGQQQLRPSVQMAPQRNGHLAPPPVNAQGIPQAQMRNGMHPNMQMAPNPGQVGNGQAAHFAVQSANMQSPGSNMTTQQYLAQNQALLQAAYQQQHRQANGGQTANMHQQMSSSPNMAPPPTPQTVPQQLSSGHVPQIIAIQTQLRAANPGLSEEQLKAMATQQMKAQSQSSSQARQNAISAAAGISPQQNHAGLQYNQGSYQRNSQQLGMNGMYNMGADGNAQQQTPTANGNSPQSHYAQKMWQRQHQMMHSQNSPNMSHAQLNGSPSMAPASPSMHMGTPVGNMNGQRPPSRSAMNNGMQSPGALQGSPVQASMAR